MSWSCPNCTFVNSKSHLSCICGTEVPIQNTSDIIEIIDADENDVMNDLDSLSSVIPITSSSSSSSSSTVVDLSVLTDDKESTDVYTRPKKRMRNTNTNIVVLSDGSDDSDDDDDDEVQFVQFVSNMNKAFLQQRETKIINVDAAADAFSSSSSSSSSTTIKSSSTTPPIVPVFDLTLSDIMQKRQQEQVKEQELAHRLASELLIQSNGDKSDFDFELARKMQDEFDEERRARVEANKNNVFDVLGEHRKTIQEYLQKTKFAEIVGEILDIKTNPHSLPGTPQYQRFVLEWQRVADQTVELVYHGTAEANVDIICRNGLDPARRRGQAYGPGEYFAGTPAISLGYCKGGTKMLIFACLMDKTGLTNNIGNIIVINKVEHQLPLFTVSFQTQLTATQAMAGSMAAIGMAAKLVRSGPLSLQQQVALTQRQDAAMNSAQQGRGGRGGRAPVKKQKRGRVTKQKRATKKIKKKKNSTWTNAQGQEQKD